MSRLTSALWFSLSLFTLASCSNERDDGKNSGKKEYLNQQEVFKAPILTVKDSAGKPVAGASILVGSAKNNPFVGNEFVTDSNGQAVISAAWILPESVTIVASGFLPATFLQSLPQDGQFTLQPRPFNPTKAVTGKVTNIPVADKDGKGDFAFVLPPLNKQEILAFNLNSVLSPERETITVSGNDISVPTNLSLPKQKERYSIITVTLNKEHYKVGLTRAESRLFTARGQFPFKKVIDEFRNGRSFVELLNEFHIVGGGFANIGTGPTDISAVQMNFSGNMSMQAPALQADEVLIAAPINESSGMWYPSDVKTVASGQSQSLNLPTGGAPLLLSVLKLKSELHLGPMSDRMSATLVDFKNGVRPDLFPLQQAPQVSSWKSVSAPILQAPTGIQRLATYAVLNQVTYTKDKSGKKIVGQVLTPAWQVYARDWTNVIELPDLPALEPKGPKATSIRRWTVSYLGTQNPGVNVLGPEAFALATHITTTSQDF